MVAEVAQAHDGSLGAAHAYIDAAARAGADLVKFQTHIAAAESTPSEPWRVAFSRQDPSRYEYWRRMEFTAEQWAGLRDHARERELGFLSSPFSLEAFDLLEDVGVDAWKVASGEVGNLPLLERMIATGRPILLSSGMSSWAELDAAVARVKRGGNDLAVLQCSSIYPTPAEKVGLNVLAELKARYDCAVGLSDHSGTIWPGLAAAVLGAEWVEVHVTFSRESFGPDAPASVTIDELAQLVDGIRFLARAGAHPVEKDALAGELAVTRAVFTKSVVAREPMAAGTVLTADRLALKKPGGGIPPERIVDLVGRRLRRSLAADERVAEDDLEPIRG